MAAERSAFQEVARLRWSNAHVVAAFRCTIPIAIVLTAGLAYGSGTAGVVAAGGAMSVGMASLKQVMKSHTALMVVTALGMTFSTVAGTLGGKWLILLVALAALWGWMCGMLTAVGQDAYWIGLQCVIALGVAGFYPNGWRYAGYRAGLILVGAVLQIVVAVLAVRTGVSREGEFDWPHGVRGSFEGAMGRLRDNLNVRSDAFQFGLRLALTLAVATATYRLLGLERGYWIPMTALLVLKPTPHDTRIRGVARSIGTIVGAGVATAIAVILRPGPILLVVLVGGFAWLCFAILDINYAAFAVAITAYIVFLLAIAGLPEPKALVERTGYTVAGGMLALAMDWLWRTAAHMKTVTS